MSTSTPDQTPAATGRGADGPAAIAGERAAFHGVTRKGAGRINAKTAGGATLIVAGAVAFLYVVPGTPRTTEPPKVTHVRGNVSFEPAREPPPAPVQASFLGPQATPVQAAPLEPSAPVNDEEEKLLRASRRAPVVAYSKNGTQARTASAPVTPLPDPAATGSTNGAYAQLDASGGGSGGGYAGAGGTAGGFNGTSRGSPSAAAQRNEFQAKLQPTTVEGVRAGHLGNRDFVIAMGTQVPCTLETAMSSDQPGFISCVVTRDILSDNGRVVLLDKGTQVVGEYRGGLQRGQRRMFVLWTRAKTPTGVIVSLASPGTDALGRAGFTGEIDTHFLERFGAAMLLSLIEDGSRLGVATLQSGGSGTVVVPTATQNGIRDAASVSVQESINIPPTLMKNQGDTVNIFVARDLDFSSVYGLRVTEPRGRVLDRAASGDFSTGVVPAGR